MDIDGQDKKAKTRREPQINTVSYGLPPGLTGPAPFDPENPVLLSLPSSLRGFSVTFAVRIPKTKNFTARYAGGRGEDGGKAVGLEGQPHDQRRDLRTAGRGD